MYTHVCIDLQCWIHAAAICKVTARDADKRRRYKCHVVGLKDAPVKINSSPVAVVRRIAVQRAEMSFSEAQDLGGVATIPSCPANSASVKSIASQVTLLSSTSPSNFALVK